MKKPITLTALGLLWTILAHGQASFVPAATHASIVPRHLRCEYLTDPSGIDESCPRLGWTLAASKEKATGQTQTAYRILVSSSPVLLAEDKGDCWDSHWVGSDNMQLIEYHGSPLVSDKPYFWKVRVRDEAGNESAWSAPARWSTGLLTPMDWTAHWIGAADVYDPTKPDCNIADPWFRKTFNLEKSPSRATLFVASVGYHEVYVNGEKIGDGVLAPKVTDNSRRARYLAYDLAPRLRAGPNVIAIWLGASWSIYAPYATDDKPRAPLVIAQADIYSGAETPQIAQPGQPIRIQTDASWKTHPSPNQLLGSWSFWHMGGEIWDARKELPHWNEVECNDSSWTAATVYHPKLTLSAQMVEQNHLYHEIHAKAIETRPDGSYRIDMGVNFAGWTEIHVHGQPGKRIDLQFSEREKEDMTFNNYSAYIPDATGNGTFHNRFNYSSGRWITIKGLTERPKLTDIRGWVARTAYDSATTFECSDSLQNWIYDRARWNYENLSVGGYLVDCPQRERMGYGGDANATCETGLLNYQTAAMYTQWLEDWRDVQGTRSMDPLNYGGRADEGILPHTAPTYWGGGGPSWGGITVVLPWYLYLHEGDTRVLQKNFSMVQRWLAFLDSHVKDNLLVRFGGAWDFLGDWLWPHAGAQGMNNDKPQNICYNNCYRVYDLRTAAKIARILGRTQEAERWEQEASDAAQAINAKYYHPDDHSYADSSMGNLAIALLAEVPTPDQRAEVMKRLEKEILVVQKGHIDVGITGGAFLFRLLRLEGLDDLLYSMTSQTDYPGWGYMKANGATSLWEMWEKDLPGHSLLHSSYLYPAAWDVQGLGGIHPDPQSPGYHHFIIRVPQLRETQLSWAKTSFESPAGLIKTAWERKNGQLHLTVTVPPNTHAAVYFPGPNGTQEPHEVPAGTYEFSTNQPAASKVPRQAAVSKAPHIVNIINFIRLLEPRDSAITENVLYQTVVSQIKAMQANRLGGTFLLQYDALMDPRYQQLLKSLPDSNFEIGAWWEITQPHVERAGLHWRGRYPWDSDANVDFSTGYTFEQREKLVDVYMEDFKKIYGRYPASVGSWFIDSYTLDYMYRKYGIVATCNCKDQIGTDGYTLWGGYWNQAYYPSRKNAYMPAQTVGQQLPVPVFRMLGSDPIRQYESGIGSNGQGVITLEPVYPHAGGDSAWVHWYFDQFAHGACMTYAYTQVGQENSFTWSAMSKGLNIQLPLIARLRDSGLVQVQTLGESGRWFKKHFRLTPPTAVTADHDINDTSDKKAIWFDSPFFRLSIGWDKNKLRIRDLHLFDENISDNIKKDSASGSYALLTLPFVDGFVWSDKDHLAGLRLKTVVDGRQQELTGGDPIVTDSVQGKLHITWPLNTGDAAFVIDVDEQHIKMHMEGRAPEKWWLELTTAPRAVLPFTHITPRIANARFHGTDYAIRATKGFFKQDGVLKITPEQQTITLFLAHSKDSL